LLGTKNLLEEANITQTVEKGFSTARQAPGLTRKKNKSLTKIFKDREKL
jgi:hypothetical protein